MGFIEEADIIDAPSGGRFIDESELIDAPSFGATDAAMTGIPFADEFAAGARTLGQKTIMPLLDAITGAQIAPETGWSDTYSNNLAAQRGAEREYFKANPVKANALAFAGSSMVPLGKANKFTDTVKQGAKLGAVYGFAGGEGDATDRLKSGAIGTGTGAAIGTIIGGSAKLMEKLSGMLPEFARSQNRKSIGTRQGDYSKSPQTVEVPTGGGEVEIESKVKRTLDDLLDNGYLGESRKPQELLKTISIREKELATDVGRLIHDADKKVIPDWAETIKFLESGRGGEKTELFAEKLAKLDDLIQTKGKGQLTYLQQQKVAKGTEWNPNDSLINDFNRAVYADMQRAIEEAQPLVKPLNQELAKLKTVKPIVKRSLDAAENKDLGNKIIDFTKTTGGVGVPMIIGSYLGDTEGAAAGAALGLGIKGATTPGGRLALSKLARKLAPLLATSGEATRNTITGILGATTSRESQKQPSESTKEPPAGQAPKGENQTVSLFNPNPVSIFNQKGKKSIFGNKGSKMSSNFNLKKELEDPKLAALVQAVVGQESAGKPDAESEKGALGLMQVMPETAKDIAKELGVKDYDLKDPETNLVFGTYYLKQMLERFGGDVELALSAYHSGPNRVAKLLEEAGGSKLSDIIDQLGPVGQKYASGVLSRLKGVA